MPSGIVFVNRNGLRWRDAPSAYGPHKTLHNRRKRWGEAGVFTRMMEGLAAVGAEPQAVMIDATYLKAHRAASSLRVKRGSRPPYRAHQRRHEHQGSPELVEGLHAVADANGRPLSFFMTAGQASDYTGTAALLDDLPKAQWLLGDRGYDADWFRDALQAKGIQTCIPGWRSRNESVGYDKRRYRRRSSIEIMFGRLKD